MDKPDIITVDESNFQLQVLEYSEHVPVVVDFWAKWCRDCPQTSQQLENLAAKHAGQFRLGQANVDHNPGLVQEYGVHTLPTVKTFKNGVVSSQLEGIRTSLQIKDYFKKVVPGPEQLLLERAASYLRDRQHHSVEDTCLEILEEDPDNPPAKLLLAKTLLWQGEYLEALTLLNHFPASREFPSAEKLAPLAEALLTSEGLSGAEQTLDPIYSRALQLIKNDNIPAALDGLLEIIRVDKKYRGGITQGIILGVFELLGEDHPVTVEYRQLLANTLF